MLTDPIADLLTRIRNAQMRKHRAVRVRASGTAERLLNVLKDEGFIEGFEACKDRSRKFDEMEVVLKYAESGRPAMQTLRRMSRPGRRLYNTSEDLPKVHSGLGIAIVSTSQGLMSDREARKRRIGGELIAIVE
jgi:small subunit ribosomal protein S8